MILLGFIALFIHIGAFIAHNSIYKNNEEWNRLTKLDVFYFRNQVLGLLLLLTFVELLNYLTFHPLFGPWVGGQSALPLASTILTNSLFPKTGSDHH